MQGADTRRKRARKRTVIAAIGATSIFIGGDAIGAGMPNHLRDVKVHASDGVPGGAEVEVAGTDSPLYNVRLDGNAKRLLVDISNADFVAATNAITDSVGVVGGVLAQSFRTDTGPMARLSISLAQPVKYKVIVDGTKLRIVLSPAGAANAPVDSAAPSNAPATAKGAEPALDPSTPQVQDIRFERSSVELGGRKASDFKGDAACGASGCDRLVIRLSRIPAYRMLPGEKNRLRLELKNTRAPESLCRTLDVTAYHGALSSISTFYDPSSSSTIVEVDRTKADEGALIEHGDALVWTFRIPANDGNAAPQPASKGFDGGPARRILTVAREELPNVPPVLRGIHDDDKVETVGGGEAGFAAHLQGQITNGHYTGRKIDLDLMNTDIHNVLRLIADVGKVNIVTADDVQGTVTIQLKNVPWDQALDVVLQAKGLGMVRQGNLIRVAPMAELQKERELRLAQAKSEFELTPLETRLIPVSYARADELQPRAHELLSPRGSIAVDDRTNVLIARDIVANLDHVEQLVHALDTQTPQVLVEARIVEATSNYSRDIGIQWGGDATFSNATGNPTGVAFPSKVTAVGGASDNATPTGGLSPFSNTVPTPNFAVNLPAATGTNSGGALGLNFGSIDNNFNLDVRLSAAETEGLVRIVSNPRILTLDNRDARINQGTLIPYSQVSALGVQTTFQEAKLQLLVRPHVTAEGSVSMHVKLTRDEPNFQQTGANGAPTILKREAETDLLVMDGRTAVIGGIYTRNTGRQVNQVPFFGDIPILGLLFQRRTANDSRTELVIFLTPRIVNRAEALGR